MIRLYSWLLRRFMAAFAILVVVQLAVYILGLNLILSGYEKSRLEQYEILAAEILAEPEKASGMVLPGTNPFFVFSADRELVFSNRGRGRSLPSGELRALYRGGKITGYFHAGELGFAENQANRVFLISVIILSGLSVILSVVIGFVSARLSSRKITEPVGELRGDIHALRSLRKLPSRGFDIAELAAMAEDVSAVSEALMRQEDYKKQWLRDLSHDLRTPLAGLKSQLEAMADGVIEPSAERFKRHLLEIERLESLAVSIGTLTEIESRTKIGKEHLEAESFAEMLKAPYEMEMRRKSITFETDIRSDGFYGDRQLLLRGIGNIISNSVKFTEEGGRIRMSISDAGAGDAGKTVISIENDGPGIPESQRELIFTRLFRGDSGRTSPGSGLGLSITREIVNLHGGEVRAEPLSAGDDSRGVRFTVVLPE